MWLATFKPASRSPIPPTRLCPIHSNMPSLLDVAIDFTTNLTNPSIESLDFHLSQVVRPAMDELLAGPCTAIADLHELPGDENEVYVVHYTSLATLYAIVNSQIEWTRTQENSGSSKEAAPSESEPAGADSGHAPCFRLYDSAHVNDPQEGVYFGHHIPNQHEWLNEFDRHRAYIASFILPRTSTDDAGDNLVFWRTYGREGEGCSISLAIPRHKLRRVKYGASDVQKSWELLAPALDRVDSLVDSGSNLSVAARRHFRESVAHMVWTSLGSIRYLYKSEAYRYERECRVVLPQSSNDARQDSVNYCFQSTGQGGRIRHFVEDSDLKIKNMFSSGTVVYVGPCCRNQEDLVHSITTLLSRAELYGPVTPSGIKYRQVS